MSHGGKPYNDEIVSENVFIRKFSAANDSEEFEWHRDRENRIVEILEGDGWKFQLDNHLPFELFPGDKIIIEKNEWHRIFKGSNDLKVVIKNVNDR